MQPVSLSHTIATVCHCYEMHIVGWRGWGTSGTVLPPAAPGWVDHHKSVKLQAQQDGKARGGILGTHSCSKVWKLNRLQISPEIEKRYKRMIFQSHVFLNCYRVFTGLGHSKFSRWVSGLQSDISWQDRTECFGLVLPNSNIPPLVFTSNKQVRCVQL